MPLPDLVVKITSKEKKTIADTVKRYLAMKSVDDSVRPVSFLTPCIEGEFDQIGWVVVPPFMKDQSESADRFFTREASAEEKDLGAERDNEQMYRIKDGVQERRYNGNWMKSLGYTESKSTIPAHVHIFGHKDGIVMESLGYIETYQNASEYVVAVHTHYGPVPRTIRVEI